MKKRTTVEPYCRQPQMSSSVRPSSNTYRVSSVKDGVEQLLLVLLKQTKVERQDCDWRRARLQLKGGRRQASGCSHNEGDNQKKTHSQTQKTNNVKFNLVQRPRRTFHAALLAVLPSSFALFLGLCLVLANQRIIDPLIGSRRRTTWRGSHPNLSRRQLPANKHSAHHGQSAPARPRQAGKKRNHHDHDAQSQPWPHVTPVHALHRIRRLPRRISRKRIHNRRASLRRGKRRKVKQCVLIRGHSNATIKENGEPGFAGLECTDMRLCLCPRT